jgi:hypothetical protein
MIGSTVKGQTVFKQAWLGAVYQRSHETIILAQLGSLKGEFICFVVEKITL